MPPKRYNPFRIPDELLNDVSLLDIINKALPSNYNFEVHKSIWRIRCLKAKCVALQMPEGLLRFATALSEIFKLYGKSSNTGCNGSLCENEEIDIVVLGDVTYGACCVDDFSAIALGVDLLIHYGHSCLIPVESPAALYVFVDIKFDLAHFIETIKANFSSNSRFALLSTIQFVSSLPSLKKALTENGFIPTIPQVLPLSPGEVLGCTSPKVGEVEALLFIGDGRFHLESAMIANPGLPAYKYDAYDKSLTRERYDHEVMRHTRRKAIEAAVGATRFGIILGTLGRQGSPSVVEMLEKRIKALGKKTYIVLMSEVTPQNLDLFGDQVDVWIQVACPRLSIDWGMEFSKPLLTPYEASAALGVISATWDDSHPYPADYYAYDSLGPWTPNHVENRPSILKNQVSRSSKTGTVGDQ